jgi:hypothetical protein
MFDISMVAVLGRIKPGSPDVQTQYSLFENPLRAEKARDLYEAVDALSEKYGKHTVHLGASHLIEVCGKGRRGIPTVREQTRLYGETGRKHLNLPILHVPAAAGPANADEVPSHEDGRRSQKIPDRKT